MLAIIEPACQGYGKKVRKEMDELIRINIIQRK
jgi:hypothetical protein